MAALTITNARVFDGRQLSEPRSVRVVDGLIATDDDRAAGGEQAPLSPVDALRAATSAPAALFGLSDRGSIGPGPRADLLLVEGDPTADIAATRDIRGVWIAGDRVR